MPGASRAGQAPSLAPDRPEQLKSRALRSVQEALEHVQAICFTTGPPRHVGVELEWTVHHADDPRRPLGPNVLRAALGDHAPHTLHPTSPHRPLPSGATITVGAGWTGGDLHPTGHLTRRPLRRDQRRHRLASRTTRPVAPRARHPRDRPPSPGPASTAHPRYDAMAAASSAPDRWRDHDVRHRRCPDVPRRRRSRASSPPVGALYTRLVWHCWPCLPTPAATLDATRAGCRRACTPGSRPTGLRGHLEVRWFDAQPPDEWIAPTALLVALLADQTAVLAWPGSGGETMTVTELRQRIAVQLERARARTTALADAVDDHDLPLAPRQEGRTDRWPRPPATVLIPGGLFTMGTSTEPWALDNERPAHAARFDPATGRSGLTRTCPPWPTGPEPVPHWPRSDQPRPACRWARPRVRHSSARDGCSASTVGSPDGRSPWRRSCGNGSP